MCIHIFFLKIRFWVQNESFDELSKEEPFIPCKQVGEILFPFHQDSPLFSPYLSLISHPCVLVSFLREIWLNFKALVDHWESTTISRKKKRKKLDPFNGLISPLYFEKKERLKKKKKKGSNPPYSYIWYFNLLFIYCSMTRL